MNNSILKLVGLGCIALILLSNTIITTNNNTSITNNPYGQEVETLMSKMTLRQKIGQMAQITLDVIGKGDNEFSSFDPFEIDTDQLDKATRVYGVGSILNTTNNTPLSVEKWKTIMEAIQQESIKHSGIPILYGVDAIHGVTYTKNSTLFPQQIGLAASFNLEMAYDLAKISAYETRASNIPWNFSPVLDLGLDPRWSRHWETFGEDVLLTTKMGEAIVKGYQGESYNIGKYNTAACLKHFLGYSVPVTGKDRTPAYIANKDLKQYHLPAFKKAIELGVASIMVNSGLINDVPVHANKKILTDLLKNELKFEGVVVTDWADVDNLHYRDKVASSEKEAVMLAINAGIDMAMIPYNLKFCDYLYELVQEGKVAESRIDDAVRRILALKFRLGLFEQNIYDTQDYPQFSSEEHHQKALEAAKESITLLKNTNNTLPLNKSSKVLITGPNANSMRTLNGAWSYSWQGERADEYAKNHNTIVEAMTEIGNKKISFSPGVNYNSHGSFNWDHIVDIDAAIEAAKEVDYIVACVGENTYTEKPGDLNDLNLSDNQQKLVKAMYSTGKPVILLVNSGRPRIITNLVDEASAIVVTYLPGNKGGDAIASILYGDTNPSGKLPFSYPRYVSTFVNYNHKPSEAQDRQLGAYNYKSDNTVLFPFGYGLSYTTFKYSDLTLDESKLNDDGNITVAVKVTNTGNIEGKETVLMFTKDLYASLSPDVKKLSAFTKLSLEPGEIKTVSFDLNVSQLAFVNSQEQWITEKGDFEIVIHDLSSKFELKKNYLFE